MVGRQEGWEQGGEVVGGSVAASGWQWQGHGVMPSHCITGLISEGAYMQKRGAIRAKTTTQQ